jgi:hypothetical protein
MNGRAENGSVLVLLSLRMDNSENRRCLRKIVQLNQSSKIALSLLSSALFVALI